MSLASSSWRRCRGSGRAEAGLTSADAGSRDDQAPAEDHQQRRWIRRDRPQSSANDRRRRKPEGLDSVSQRRVLLLDRAEHRVHAVRGHGGDASDLLRPGPSVTKPAPDGGRRHAELGSDRSMARAGCRPGQRGEDGAANALPFSERRSIRAASRRRGRHEAGSRTSCARSHHSTPAVAEASAAGHPPLGPVDGRPAPGPQTVGAVAADGPAGVQVGFGPVGVEDQQEHQRPPRQRHPANHPAGGAALVGPHSPPPPPTASAVPSNLEKRPAGQEPTTPSMRTTHPRPQCRRHPLSSSSNVSHNSGLKRQNDRGGLASSRRVSSLPERWRRRRALRGCRDHRPRRERQR